jgi:hypothetical protein
MTRSFTVPGDEHLARSRECPDAAADDAQLTALRVPRLAAYRRIVDPWWIGRWRIGDWHRTLVERLPKRAALVV